MFFARLYINIKKKILTFVYAKLSGEKHAFNETLQEKPYLNYKSE